VQRFDGFDPFEELLIGFGILRHHLCAPVDGEDQRIPGRRQPGDQFRRLAL
jgi:hypothetical protein